MFGYSSWYVKFFYVFSTFYATKLWNSLRTNVPQYFYSFCLEGHVSLLLLACWRGSSWVSPSSFCCASQKNPTERWAKRVYGERFSTLEIVLHFLFSLESINPWHPDVNMRILLTVLYTFPEMLTGRSCFTDQKLLLLVIISVILMTLMCDSGVIL